MNLQRAVQRLLITLVAIDLGLILANVLGAPSFLLLDAESNFPTWYSSTKLLGTALAAIWCMGLESAESRRGLQRLVWPTVAALFVGLSMDETATAHERLTTLLMAGSRGDALRTRLLGGDALKDAFIWPVLFSPVIIAVLYVLGIALYSRLKHDRLALWLGCAGCVAFVAAIALEGPVVYLSPPVRAWSEAEIARYQLLTLIEESAELFGATMMLAALLLHAQGTIADTSATQRRLADQ